MNDTLLEFPCNFPIKIMAMKSTTMRASLEAIASGIGVETVSLTERPSRTGKYMAFTLTVVAQSKDQLDNLYQRISEEQDVKVVL